MENIDFKKSLIKNTLFIFTGCLISSLGINLFLSQAKLLSGGATGIALLLQYILNIPTGITIFLINIPLLIISYKFLSKPFTAYTALGSLSLSAALMITKPLCRFINLTGMDMLLYCIYGGVICGIGYGIVFLKNGSTGGTDIITMLIRKKHPDFNIGTLSFAINLLIVLLGAFLFGAVPALYTLISIFIQSTVLDKMLNGFESKKLLLILTNKDEAVINYIIKVLNRGVTSLAAEGEFTHHKHKMLYCIVTSRQMIMLRNAILHIDPSAFITIVDISEVKGKGFVAS